MNVASMLRPWKRYAIVMVLVAVACGGGSGDEGTQTTGQDAHLSLEQQAWKAVEDGALLLDVRSDREFDAGHLRGAVHLPFDQVGDNLDKVGDDKDRPIVVYCAVGVRAEAAKRALARHGYKNVINARSYSKMLRAQPQN